MTHYHLNFARHTAHLVGVSLSFVAKTDNPTLYLPSWIAGSYMIREFAKNIPNITAIIGTTTQRVRKLTKNQWQLDAKQGDKITLNYDVYCHDLSVRTAYVDSERIFGNFSSFLLLIKNDEFTPCTIELNIPNSFYKPHTKLATGLPFQEEYGLDDTIYHFDKLPNGTPLTTFESLDFPFELGRQDEFDFTVKIAGKTTAHRFFLSGVHACNFERLKADLTEICQSYADWLGWLPFDEYTFMTYASKDGYGGLEHINSTALMTPRDDLPTEYESALPSEDYQRFLGLCSHEYFHSWWVKSVRPDVMMTSLLDEEAYTPLLWVFEGFTSYIDDLMLYRSGVIDKTSYLNLLSSQINRYQNTEGRHHQTVAESSFDAWIKLYRPDENSQNSTVSYYNKGALVALGLDLLLMDYDKRLFDVISHFARLAKDSPTARFGMSNDNLDKAMTQFLPKDVWEDFKNRYVNGVDELPIGEWLAKQDITIDTTQKDEPFGIVCESNTSGLLIKRLHPKASASMAGLSANDTIIAIDGLKADSKGLQTAFCKAKHGKSVHIHAFRRDVLLEFNLTLNQSNPINTKATLSGSGGNWLDR